MPLQVCGQVATTAIMRFLRRVDSNSTKDKKKSPMAADPADQERPHLEIRDLECIRGNRVLFRHLNFEAEAGQIIQVEGANGSGKTTLLRALCGLGLPTDGSIHWCGEDITQNPADYLAALTYIGHLPGIKLELTARENLAMDRALNRSLGKADNRLALAHFGLESFVDSHCRFLSAGQKKRVALARLLVRDSILWFLDEPFTAVDQTGVGILSDVISGFVNDGGIVILTSHQQVDFAGCQLRTIRLGR